MSSSADSHSTSSDDTAPEFWLYGYGQVPPLLLSPCSFAPHLPPVTDLFFSHPLHRSLIWKPPPHFGTHQHPQHPNPSPGVADAALGSAAVAAHTNNPPQTGAYQATEDHRGTPESPGRVVTLIERSYWEDLTDHHHAAPERVWGVAYRIRPERVAEVKAYLDIREINGYSIHYAPFQPAEGSEDSIQALVYIGTPDNAQFVGPQDPQALAEHIFRSRGPSGPNKDYLLGLDAALEHLSPESGDEHVADLARRVRALEQAAT